METLDLSCSVLESRFAKCSVADCNDIWQQAFRLACRKSRFDILAFLRVHQDQIKTDRAETELSIYEGLIAAIKRRDFEMLTFLVKTFRPNLNFTGDSWTTCLLAAVKESQLNMVRFLLDQGADANQAKDKYNSCLHYACCCQRDSFEVLKVLLENGANVDAVNYAGNTPLHMACTTDREDMAACLLQHGASAILADSGGRDALVLACHASNLSMVQLLLDQRPDRSPWERIESDPPVVVATRNGSLGIVKALINHEPRVDYKLHDGQTLTHIACEFAKHDVLNWLLSEQEYNPNARDNNEMTPLHVLCTTSAFGIQECNKIECIRLLARAKANLNELDMNGNAPIHYAVQSRHAKVLKTLLNSGAFVDQRNRHGETALHIVCSLSSDIPAPRYARSTNAVVEDIRETLALLLCEHGADSTALDRHGNPAFFLAAEMDGMASCSFEMVRSAAVQGFFDGTQKHMNNSSNCPGHAAKRRRIV